MTAGIEQAVEEAASRPLEEAPELPFIPPAKPVIGEEEIEAAVRVLRSGYVVQGPEVAAFEDEFASLVDGRHCVAVNSGTSALVLALVGAGIGAGDEVIVPSFTFAATANCVRLAGATPVFADIDPDTFCLDPESVKSVISRHTAAIMPVHLYGQPADMDRLGELASAHNLAVFEDAAQAHGAALHGTPAGAFGEAACFSFYPTKNMHALEGGMVVTADTGLARRIRLLRNQGMERQYANEMVGYNMRLTDVAAAIGREQLRKLPAWNEQRRTHAAVLNQGLAGLGSVRTPVIADGVTHVYHQYTVRVLADQRDELQAHLKDQGIGSAVYYPTPTHRLPPFAALADDDMLPETNRAATQVLSLPVHPSLAEADLARIVEAVRSFDLGEH